MQEREEAKETVINSGMDKENVTQAPVDQVKAEAAINRR